MGKIALEILGLSASHSQSGSFALVLVEAKGTKRLPIIIGLSEAQAIAMVMEKIIPERPMTHDLFKPLAESFNFELQNVLISDFTSGVFYAKMTWGQNDNVIEFDARPSDAIAMALRFDAPIFTTEKVLEDAGIRMEEIEDAENESEIIEEDGEEENEEIKNIEDALADFIEEDAALEEEIKEVTNVSNSNFRNISTEQLEILLSSSIEVEDYEKAAQIRDELDKRK